MLFIFFTVFLQACSLRDGEEMFSAVDGQLDLTEWNADKSVIPLNGQWDLYWNQLLEPHDFTKNSTLNQTGVINVPSNWYTNSINGEPLPKEGYATLRLQVSVAKLEKNEILGMRVPYIHSNYNLWIDDQFVASVGQVGSNKMSSAPQMDPKVVYFSPKGQTFTVTLQISNYRFVSGGVLEPITFGKAGNIHSSYFNKVIFQSIMIGVLILAGIYHIGLSFFRKMDTYFFYFGVFCLVAAFRSTMMGDIFFTKAFPDFNWELAMKLNYFALYAHVPLLAVVFYRLYPQDSSKWFTKICIFVAVLYNLFTLVTPTKIFLANIMPFYLFMIVGVFYTFFVVSKSLKRKQEGSYFLLTGIAVLMACILFDVSGAMLQYPQLNIYMIGIVIAVICFSLLLSKRLSTSLALSVELAEDLSKLNSDLETKVEQRTEQIQQSNQKLEELNNKLKEMALVDGLTNIPNRRQFDEYFAEQYEKCKKEQVPLSVIFFDIDYFKAYNDWYGHQMGDTCLKQVAQTINKVEDGLAARYGGEEFVCVLPNRNQTNAEQMAKSLNEQVEQLKIPHEKSVVSNYVTVSIGITTVIPSESTTKKTILNQADQALYQAKTSGRNRVVSFFHE